MRTKSLRWRRSLERLGWSHVRPDYSDLDARREVSLLGDVPGRLERLLALARDAVTRGPVVLAGSSSRCLYIGTGVVAGACSRSVFDGAADMYLSDAGVGCGVSADFNCACLA